MKIKHYDLENEINECFEVMKALRPKLTDAQELVTRVMRQQKESYRILGIEVNGRVVALAGYRELENLVHGKFIYVDDLISAPDSRGKNYGKVLLQEISAIAKELGKDRVVLDTALSNSQAQKFYYREGFLGLGMHFLKDV